VPVQVRPSAPHYNGRSDAAMNAAADKYAQSRADRQRFIDKVVQSKSRKKIVVAGPGTGKTFLFKELLKGKNSALTLTFINSLVEDLSLELCGLSDVKTLHGFARWIMGQATRSAKIFPKMSQVIKEDAEIILAQKIDFDTLFHNMDDGNEHIALYKARKTLYGHYGFTDVIFAAVKFLEQNQKRIPVFDQVIVDEFQDFNLLEVSLIELLASKSPILITGDDDQSLYYFKNASPSYIRDRHRKGDPYEAFNLPYCSRCTRVIVEAINDVIKAAVGEGFLKGRIDKPYLYFEDEKKEVDCAKYPSLSHVRCFAKQFPYFIAKTIAEIAEERREKFSVLIIAPTKARCRSIARALRSKGLENVLYVDQQAEIALTAMDCLSLLSEDKNCNLGWRIAAKLYMSKDEFRTLLEATAQDPTKPVSDLIPSAVKKRVKSALSAFKKVNKEKTINKDASTLLFAELSLDVHALAQDRLRETIRARAPRTSNPAIRNIPIKITTIPSSKGLAQDYVFVVDFDDRLFLEKDGKCSDQKIYDFLVALTRARKKIYLVSGDAKEPKFLTWIKKERIETKTMSAAVRDGS
jgi:superfamily I DNA/RNA helicase